MAEKHNAGSAAAKNKGRWPSALGEQEAYFG
jgi:hypothetical protein